MGLQKKVLGPSARENFGKDKAPGGVAAFNNYLIYRSIALSLLCNKVVLNA
jgi:hypothetical protein